MGNYQEFLDYVFGHKFVIYPDNNPLTYIPQKAKLDTTGHRQFAALSSYDFSIINRMGSRIVMLMAFPTCHVTLMCPRVNLRLFQWKTFTAGAKITLFNIILKHFCMSTNHLVDQIDSQGFICPKDWKGRQRDNPIIGTCVRAVTKKTKPNSAEVTSKEGSTMTTAKKGFSWFCLVNFQNKPYVVHMMIWDILVESVA